MSGSPTDKTHHAPGLQTGLQTWPHNLKRADGGVPYEPPPYRPRNGVLRWLEDRLPIIGLAHSAAVSYPPPRNLKYLRTFRGILTFIATARTVTRSCLTWNSTRDAR